MNMQNFPVLSYEEAVRVVEDAAWHLPTQRVALARAHRRILAEDVVSDMDMPPFDKSAVDGYACLRADVPGALSVLETIAAGELPTHALHPGHCAKVMTGAPVPDGTECVVMVERSEPRGDAQVYLSAAPVSGNFVLRAHDVATGDTVLCEGEQILAAHAAVLATAGCVRPSVYRLPLVGIISTGSEIVAPAKKPGAGHIRNSNGAQLTAQCLAMGIQAKNYGIAADTPEELRATLSAALAECDVVLTTGGVSMGDFDLIPPTLEALGMELHLRRVAIQPGKPIAFATAKDCAAFGLSGNPNSSFLQFELFVKPFLFRLQGGHHHPTEVVAPAAADYDRRNSDRMLWLPVAFDLDGRVKQVEYHGSAHIHSYTGARGLMRIPVGQGHVAKGKPVRVRLID